MERGLADSALEAGRWDDAARLLEGEIEQEESAEARDGLGRALWWLGDPDGAIEQRERAFVLLKERGDTRRAAGVAIWLAREHRSAFGNDAVANGWLARAERLIGDDHASSERGWLELARGRLDGSLSTHADEALRIALANGDADLEVAALADLGLAAIERGDVATGLDRLDEAMAAATAGEADLPETVAEACCSLVAACELAGDSGRLEQWARIVDSLLSRRPDMPSLAFCRTCNAEVLAATGRYEAAAEEFAASARDLTATGHRSRCVDPSVKLAEIRLLQGRFEEAEALLDGREGLPEAALPLADLHIERGKPALATALLLRRLDRMGGDGLRAAPLLLRLAESQLAAGDVDGAGEVSARLSGDADDTGHPMIQAYSHLAAGQVAAARRQDPTADLDIAADRFDKLQMPLEAARARLLLARAISSTEPEVAVAEARRALDRFEAAGATHEADEAAAFARTLGGPARTGPKDAQLLTRRESEVLGLLGEGLSNAEIAARLYISTKTAGHHVSNVLAKLHLRNRQEAAAFAIRHLEDRAEK
jgi:DNA-binding CsgD family transcriptional regulator